MDRFIPVHSLGQAAHNDNVIYGHSAYILFVLVLLSLSSLEDSWIDLRYYLSYTKPESETMSTKCMI
jgi:hypothetical protein